MAGALVGGAFLSATLQVLFDRLASREVMNFFRPRKNVDGLLKKLKSKLRVLDAVLNDAEVKQIIKPDVKDRLDELKDVSYQVDDLLDKIIYEHLRRKVEQSGTSQVGESSLAFDSSFDAEIESKLKEIIVMLEDFEKDKDSLGLKEGVGIPSHILPSTSLVDKSAVYGREIEKKEIIENLLAGGARGNNVPGVISIVGMGGLGKTTLAQLIYDDGEVNKYFEQKAWVCVSDPFDVLKITKSILEEITRGHSRPTENLNLVQLSLKETLRGKKFLIVLDDVWNDKDFLWEALIRPLTAGANGSTIIATTRDQKVASVVMGSIHVHNLQLLPDEHCLSLFERIAFPKGDSSAHPNLKKIGKEIVEKRCKGLPIAAEALGGLLRCRYEVQEWNIVLKSDIWDLPEDKNFILPALRLSYHYLPSHLKQCLAFASIYPKDYAIYKEGLVLLWIAQGFVQQPTRGNKTVKKVGNEYLDELVSRSFFQQVGGGGCFIKMHDLVHDLTQVISGEFSFTLDGDKMLVNISEKVRHFSYVTGENDGIERLKAIEKVKCLRTFLTVGGRSNLADYSVLDDNLMLDVLPTSHLRVFSLGNFRITEVPEWIGRIGNFRIMKVPEWIGRMIHLRYLDLCRLHITCLPDSVCSLYNLQTLVLTDTYLTTLPKDIGKLISLRHLYLGGTLLTEMPTQISQLKGLQELTDFVVGKDSGSGVNGLKELHQLQGKLCISNLQNVTRERKADALEANLKEKELLQELTLEWGRETDDTANEKYVLENLQPHINLERLRIRYYGGTTFPGWLGDRSFSNTVFLLLENCEYCISLPPVGQLPSLKDLTIKRMKGITKLGLEFYGDVSLGKPFQSLVRLTFDGMEEWEEWSTPGAGEFSWLQDLSVRNCPKLQNISTLQLSSLENLDIRGCPELESFPPLSVFPNLRDLRIDNFTKLKTLLIPDQKGLQNATSLEYVEINSCPSMVSLEQLVVIECPEIESFPEAKGVLPFSNLRRINISDCKKLKALPKQMPSLQVLHVTGCPEIELFVEGGSRLPSLQKFRIHSCPEIESFLEGGLPSNLRELDISCCKKLKALPERMHLLLPSLQKFRIHSCPEIESVPEGGLPSNLRELEISYCEKLKALPERMHLLPSLKIFRIDFCPEIESFPEGGLPSNLRELDVSSCEKLKALPEKMHLLPSLQKFRIDRCPEIESFPEGGLPSNLRELEISNCEKLKALPERMHLLLPSLQKFRIDSCPEIESFPEGGLPSDLRELDIGGCEKLKALPERMHLLLPSLQKFGIVFCPEIESFPEGGLPSNLRELDIGDCEKLKALPERMHLLLPSLQKFRIDSCPEIESFPEGGLPSNLRELDISGCKKLKALPERMHLLLPSLQKFGMACCPEIESFPEGGLPSNLCELRIYDCKKLVARWRDWGIERLSSLGKLIIGVEDEEGVLESFPNEGLLPSTLASLLICNLPNLKLLNSRGLQLLGSLETLSIRSCPQLKSLPEEGLPATLKYLTIMHCPLLEPRCEREKGEDWHKIAHIPSRYIY